jgi:hypothetical protein
MFGSHKKLYRDGAETEGVVVRTRAAVNPLTVDPGYEVVVRAKFPDGSTSEFTQGTLKGGGGWLYAQSVGTPYVGQVVPVRYDPSNRSKVVVDLPALEARHQEATAEATAAQQAQLDAEVAHLGEPGVQTAVGPGGQPLGGLPGGSDLKAQILQMAAQNPAAVIDLRPSHPPKDQAPDPVGRLSKLAELKQQGLLTEEEFTAAKAKILGEC